MRLTREQVLHIAELAKLGLTEEETDLFAEQLSEILDYAEKLNQVDTASIAPTAQAIPRHNVIRADEVRPSLPTEDILANAPQKQGVYFKVKPILD